MLVTPVDDDHYQIQTLCKAAVPPFFPRIPDSGVIVPIDDNFREKFLTLLVNAERACYNAPVFASRITRTRINVVKDMVETYSK